MNLKSFMMLESTLHHFLETITDLLFPYRCPVCLDIARPRGSLVCDGCKGRLPVIKEPCCKKCGKVLLYKGEYCADCTKTSHDYDAGRSVFTYKGPVGKSIIRMKYFHKRDLAVFYAWAIEEYAGDFIDRVKPEIIIGVPIHKRRRIKRGFNQSHDIAEELSKLTGIPLGNEILKRIKATKPQKKLTYCERVRNLSGSIFVTRQLSYESVLIVDDIYTTGSTIDECARALKKCGVRNVYFVTVCSGAES